MLAAAQLGIAGLSVCALVALFVRRDPAGGARSIRGLVAVGTLALGGIFAETSHSLERAETQALVAVLFLYAVGVIIMTRRETDLRAPAYGTLPLLALWFWLFAVDAASGSVTGAAAWAGRGASGVLLLAAVHLARWRGITTRTFATLLTAALSVIGLISAAMPDPWRACDQFKCGYLGALLTGPFVSENFVGILAAWTCLLALLALSGAQRWASLALGMAFLMATGARSSMYALVVVVIVLLFLQRFPRLGVGQVGNRFRIRLLFVGASLTISFGTALLLLFTATPTTLSNRGNIWSSALVQLEGNFLAGLGLDRWEPLAQLGLLPAHFPHSGYLLVLFAGGVIGLSLFVLALARIMLAPEDSPRAALGRLAMVHLLLVVSLTEVMWNPLTLDGLSWTILCLLVRQDACRAAEDEATRVAQGHHPRAASSLV